MPTTESARERISDLTMRARAINVETTILRQKWSACFDEDHDRGWQLLADMSDLTGQALTIRRTLERLHATDASNPTVAPDTHRRVHRPDQSRHERHGQSVGTERRAEVGDTVSVLCRQRFVDGDSCGLIVGVFPTAADAMLYAQTNEAVAIHEWQLPRPGRRNWLRPGKQVSFTIEEHPVSQSTQWQIAFMPPEHPVDHVAATTH